jgi:cell wall-associated NlpC family hydrolase
MAFDDWLIDGAKLDADISGRIQRARSIRKMDGASTIELSVIDHDHRLRESGVLTRRGKAPEKTRFEESAWGRFGQVRLTVNGRFYRFSTYEQTPGSDVLLLVFEDEIATLLRRFKGPEKASRADGSRLDFIVSHLLSRSRAYKIVYRAPERDQKQPIKGDSAKARAKEREKGIRSGARLTVKGIAATREQRENMEIILAVSDEQNAGERATIAMLVAAIGESGIVAQMNNAGSGYGGVFQGDVAARYRYFKVNDTEEQAYYFLKGGKGFQQGGAIALAAQHPEMTPGEIATRVEASGEAPGFYDQWKGEAEKILEEWGGAGELVVTSRRRYMYEVHGEDKDTGEPAETYWDATGRLLVDEVRFRRFATENVLWMVSDDWLFKRKPVFEIESSPDVLIGAQVSVGIPVSTVTVIGRKPLWTGRPGCVAHVTEKEGPLEGRWLVDQIDEDLFELDPATLTLRRPQPKLREPAAERTVTQRTETLPEAGSTRAGIVAMAEVALSSPVGSFDYEMVRPYPRSLLPAGGQTVVTDCSGFVILVYKAAGAPDPTNRNYDGQGWTGPLWTNGKATNDPQPGDLVFWGSPTSPGAAAHVGIYIGDGKTIQFGGDPHPKKLPVNYRNDLAGYRTFDVG